MSGVVGGSGKPEPRGKKRTYRSTLPTLPDEERRPAARAARAAELVGQEVPLRLSRVSVNRLLVVASVGLVVVLTGFLATAWLSQKIDAGATVRMVLLWWSALVGVVAFQLWSVRYRVVGVVLVKTRRGRPGRSVDLSALTKADRCDYTTSSGALGLSVGRLTVTLGARFVPCLYDADGLRAIAAGVECSGHPAAVRVAQRLRALAADPTRRAW